MGLLSKKKMNVTIAVWFQRCLATMTSSGRESHLQNDICCFEKRPSWLYFATLLFITQQCNHCINHTACVTGDHCSGSGSLSASVLHKWQHAVTVRPNESMDNKLQRKYLTTSQTFRLVKICHNDYDNDNPSIGVDEIMERNGINKNKGKQDINQ